MATKYQMQAKSSANAALYSWLAAAPDWAGAGYVTAGYPGTALDVALAGGGFDNTSGGDSTSDQVIAGTDRVMAGTDRVVATPDLILAAADRVMAGTDRVTA